MGIEDLKVLAVIPARGGSKGLPGKNLKLLNGKPLIYYMINAALNCNKLDKVVCSTDDKQIAEVARECGAEVPFLRPAEFATDSSPLNPVMKHVMNYYDENNWRSDVVVSLQPTNPLITPDIIDTAVSVYMETNCDSVASVTIISHGHPYRAKKLLDNKRLIDFCPEFNGDRVINRQDRPPAYAYNGAIYLRTRELLENWTGKDTGLGSDCRSVVVEPEKSVNIDTEFDFKLAELIMKDRESTL
jgi:CMP-N-acetylneuraminic acid synthetase